MNDSAASDSRVPATVGRALIAAVVDCFPLWLLATPRDVRKRVVRTGRGAFQSSVEMVKGAGTSIQFFREIESRESIRRLAHELSEHMPDFIGLIGTQSFRSQFQGAAQFVTGWCLAIERRSQRSEHVEVDAQAMLAELDAVLRSGQVGCCWISPIAGLDIADAISPISIGRDVEIRCFSDSEIEEMASHDALWSATIDVVRERVVAGICIDAPLWYGSIPANPALVPTPSTDVHSQVREVLDCVVQALRILKPGHIRVLGTMQRFETSAPPNLIAGTTIYPPGPTGHGFNVDPDDVPQLAQLYDALRRERRSDVLIACARLGDAETRLSPSDSLIDACVGLDALLSPTDLQELTTTVCLHYALLGKKEERWARYRRLQEVYKVRGKIVHGKIGQSEAQRQEVHRIATSARECLRDVTKRFLLEPRMREVTGGKREYWLEIAFDSKE